MTVVSDTSPLNYLILIRAVDLLPALFGRVLAPPAVLAELRHTESPEVVRQWAESPSDWLEVRAPSVRTADDKLGPGETEAICLARELPADAILLDDRRARKAAAGHGLTVMGTLAVLFESGRRGLISFEQAVTSLSTTSFRVHPTILAEIRNR